MRFLFVFAIAAVLTACGVETPTDPSSPSAPCTDAGTDCRRVDPSFAGEWVGSAWLEAGNGALDTWTASVTVEVSGDTLTARGFCPDAYGSLTATGTSSREGKRVDWEGELFCPAPTPSCPSATATYTAAALYRVDSNTMMIELNGRRAGCGSSGSVFTRFNGHHP